MTWTCPECHSVLHFPEGTAPEYVQYVTEYHTSRHRADWPKLELNMPKHVDCDCINCRPG